MSIADPEKLKLVYYPDPILQRVCEPVDEAEFGDGLASIADRMRQIMRTSNGVGLAGPQVGLPFRLFVCGITENPGHDMVVVNPELLDREGVEEKEEGCLSLPGVNVVMRRAKRIRLRALDVFGQPIDVVGENLLARVWQHETDHLFGRLIIDNMSVSDELANRRAVRQLKADYKPSRPARSR